MRYGIYFFAICVVISAFTILAESISTGYKPGECMTVPHKEQILKVVEVGQYGIKAIQPHYEGFEDVYLDQDDVKNAKRMDCFDLFKIQETK